MHKTFLQPRDNLSTLMDPLFEQSSTVYWKQKHYNYKCHTAVRPIAIDKDNLVTEKLTVSLVILKMNRDFWSE